MLSSDFGDYRSSHGRFSRALRRTSKMLRTHFSGRLPSPQRPAKMCLRSTSRRWWRRLRIERTGHHRRRRRLRYRRRRRRHHRCCRHRRRLHRRRHRCRRRLSVMARRTHRERAFLLGACRALADLGLGLAFALAAPWVTACERCVSRPVARLQVGRERVRAAGRSWRLWRYRRKWWHCRRY